MPNFARLITGSQAVRDVLRRMGQPVSSGSVSASGVLIVQQMWSIATEVGKELMSAFNWPFMKAEWVLATTPGTLLYTLPDDLDMFIGSSAWNRTTTFPVVSDVNEPVWQMLKAGPVTSTLNVVYRIIGNKIELLNDPGGDTLVLPYRSRGWAQDAADPFARRDNLATDTDIVLYDEILFKAALKRAFYVEKKFDTTRVEYEYKLALEAAKNKSVVGKIIGLVPGESGIPILSVNNLPETGYGS